MILDNFDVGLLTARLDQKLREGGIYATMVAMVESGVGVMIHGRPPELAERAETRRWVVELDCFPVCIIEEWDGSVEEAFIRAWDRFKVELRRQGDRV